MTRPELRIEPNDLRPTLVHALEADLVGPFTLDPESTEALPLPPTRWYVTGFLAPENAPAEEAETTDSETGAGNDEDVDGATEEKEPRGPRTLPSSIGLSMLLPPFGVLVAKWAAVEAAVAFPPAAVILAVGSGLTAVFWIKWTGRVLSGGPAATPPAGDRLGVAYGLPLFGLLGLAVALSAAVGLLAEALVAPAVTHIHGAPGLASAPAALTTAAGSFPTWPLFVTLGAATTPDEPGIQVIDGFWMGLSKRSLQVA